MRSRPGEEVILFDGSGCQYHAIIERLGRNEVEMAITAREEIDREALIAVTLGVALPKGDRQKWLVEKVVELGVARAQHCSRPTRRGTAAKKCLGMLARRGNRGIETVWAEPPMEITEPKVWSEFLEECKALEYRFVAHPGPSIPQSVEKSKQVTIAIGPEGGFADEEIAAATSQGWKLWDLGPRILRIETAAVALAARIIGQ